MPARLRPDLEAHRRLLAMLTCVIQWPFSASVVKIPKGRFGSTTVRMADVLRGVAIGVSGLACKGAFRRSSVLKRSDSITGTETQAQKIAREVVRRSFQISPRTVRRGRDQGHVVGRLAESGAQ